MVKMLDGGEFLQRKWLIWGPGVEEELLQVNVHGLQLTLLSEQALD